MLSIQSYVRRSHHVLRRWAVDPRIHTAVRAGAHFAAGFCLSAASLGNYMLPLSLGFICSCNGFLACLAAIGGCLGYRLFWGAAGEQGLLWLALGLCAALVLGRRRRETDLLMPSVAGLLPAVVGLAYQLMFSDTTPVPIYLLRIGLAAGTCWLFTQVMRGRNPILEWLTWGVGVLALAQILPLPWLGLGYVAAGILAVAGAFPAAAVAGLALDLVQVTPVPMTAVLVLAFLIRLLPRPLGWLGRLVPGVMYISVMALGGYGDWMPLPGLVLGSIAGSFLPMPGKVAHRRGETGAAQVRLELAAGVLSQTQQLLLEVGEQPVDENALVTRAAERACGSCPCRKSCKDTRRIGLLPGALLYKPLLTAEELPIVCRKSGRFLAELHRSQEQLRSIRADRERQKEYRAAVVQQYGFLSEFLQDLSDRLARRGDPVAAYRPQVQIFGNRPQEDNGDRCLCFSGVGGRYYVLLCDGMGTGLGAVQEGKTAATLLRRMLSAGYPAEHALQSMNSLCALRDRAGAATVDLAELHLDSGKAVLYKWGAAPSYLVNGMGAEKIGVAGPPPGLGVTDCRLITQRITLNRGQLLVMVSDGISEREALRCCMELMDSTPEALATHMLENSYMRGEDDATVITICLQS